MPPSVTARRGAPDRGMLVLEQKLSILVGGPGQTRRNPALDVLTGRVPDGRLVSLQASLLAAAPTNRPGDTSSGDAGDAPTTGYAKLPKSASGNSPNGGAGPAAVVLPVAAIRMAAVARGTRPAPSPWLTSPTSDARPRLRLLPPPRTASCWARLPWVGWLLARLTGEYPPCRSSARSPRARLAS
jgi:hypothetical protein